MIKINKSILVKGLIVFAMLSCIALAGNAFCETEPYDMQNLEDVAKDNEDSNARKLIEQGVISTTDAADIWDANFAAEREIPERAETARIHYGSEASQHGVISIPSGVANPKNGAVSASQPGSANAPNTVK